MTMSLSTSTSSVSQMLQGYSIEICPGDSKALAVAIERLPRGTEVFLTWIPGSNPMDMVKAGAALRKAGCIPVPHIAARHLESRVLLEELATRLAVEAGVDRILAIGGDRAKPAGPFDSTLAVMQSQAFQYAGITRMAVAGFPEGHPSIPDEVLLEALAAKARFADADGLQFSIVTQFCFKAEPIVNWLRNLRALGIHHPVRIGLAGPAGLLTLTRYALRCGVGNSLRVLTEHPSFAKLLTEKGPEPIILDLAQACGCSGDEGSALTVHGLHMFVFGGLTKTVDWLHADRE
ncbi:MAG TPA: methylenetetrahydrofolate reductase [Acidobacteriaceae bacterium]